MPAGLTRLHPPTAQTPTPAAPGAHNAPPDTMLLPFRSPSRAVPCRRSQTRRSSGWFLLACVIGWAGAAPTVHAAANHLTGTWRFTTTDDPAFGGQVADQAWRTLGAGRAWEQQGFPDYDGFAWYRQTVTIPESLRTSAEKYGGFTLTLGQIDDVEETYFNGVLVGAKGKLPPHYETAYDVDRVYVVPASLVRWGGPNVLAIRVYDHGGNGGLTAGAPSLVVRGPLSHVVVTPDFDRADRVMTGGATRAGATFRNDFTESVTLTVAQTVTADLGNRIGTTTDTLTIEAGGSARVDFLTGDRTPGFYTAALVLTVGADQTSITVPFGIAPEALSYATDRQPDFQAFWDRARAELAGVAPQFQTTLHSVQPFENKTIYLVEMRSAGNARIRGWLGVPKRPGRYPAILHLQGYSYGFSPTDMYAGDEFITFALNVRGHGNSTDDVNPGFPGFLVAGLSNADTYMYRGAYLDCIRAVDYLLSREDVDPARIAVEGGSQGGAFAFATAALDRRVSLCVPHIPGFSEYRTWIRMVPNMNFIQYWLYSNPGATQDQVYRTLSYFDVKNLAPWITVPTLMGVGLRDVNCPARTCFAGFNHVAGPREWLVYPEAPHSLPREYHDYKIAWMKRQWGIAAEQVTTQPQSQTAAAGSTISLTAGTPGGGATYQWLKDGMAIAGASAPTLTLAGVRPADAGVYTVRVSAGATTASTSEPAVVGVFSAAKILGAGREVLTDQRVGDRVYDQILLEGAAVSVTADPGQITRVSYLDLSGDIVQVEFSGAGMLTLVLDDASGPVDPVNYHQPGVQYWKGHGRIIVAGANETTHLTVFTVGTLTAVNQALFRSEVRYDGVADIGYVAILSRNDRFGGIRTANAHYLAATGITGLHAPGIDVAGPVFIGDITAGDDAAPLLLFASAGDAQINGGSLEQLNERAVRIGGGLQLRFVEGTTSAGTLMAAQANRARIERDGVDVTSDVVVNPPS